MTIPAVARTVTVNAPIGRAFRVFTEQFNSWWPQQHHIRPVDLAEAVLEVREGGRWYERSVDGGECEWGRVAVYEPPHRLVLTWQINGSFEYDPDPAHASEVEVNFTDLGGGRTRVELEHRAFERHGDEAQRVHDGVGGPGGWPGIMDGYAKTAEAATAAA
jgi:uncharacterized protein YndB with AHSA1/START domain